MKIGRYVFCIPSQQPLVIDTVCQDKQFGGVEGWWGLFNQEFVFHIYGGGDGFPVDHLSIIAGHSKISPFPTVNPLDGFHQVGLVPGYFRLADLFFKKEKKNNTRAATQFAPETWPGFKPVSFQDAFCSAILETHHVSCIIFTNQGHFI